MEIPAYQSPHAYAHVTWMMQYNKEYLQELYDQKTLKEYLNNVTERADTLLTRLESDGYDPSAALEIVLEVILCPVQHDDYEMMEESRQKTIWKYLQQL